MNYFEHIPTKQNMGAVWGLFSRLGKMSEEEILNTRKFTHTVDIINSAMSGNINSDNFNLDGYEYSCSMNEKRDSRSRAKDELFLVFGSPSEDEPIGFGDTRGDVIPVKHDDYEDVLNRVYSSEMEEKLKSIRTSYIVKKKVDIVKLISFVIKYNTPDSVEKLKTLADENSELKDILMGIC